MGFVKRKDLMAAWIEPNNELVCEECLKDKDEDEISEILTQDDLDNSEDYYFCDRCQKRIK